MSDQNPTRARHAAYKKAFTEILGDPFALEEIEGQYNEMRRKCPMHIQRLNGLGHETKNPAKPNAMDFYCDVERVIEEVVDTNLLPKFEKIYIMGDIDNPQLSQAQRNRLEQRIGKLLIAHKIYPVRDYFKTIRKRRG